MTLVRSHGFTPQYDSPYREEKPALRSIALSSLIFLGMYNLKQQIFPEPRIDLS